MANICINGNVTLNYRHEGAPAGNARFNLQRFSVRQVLDLPLGLKTGYQSFFDAENPTPLYTEQGSGVDIEAYNSFQKAAFPKDPYLGEVWNPHKSFSAITTSLPLTASIGPTSLPAVPSGAVEHGPTNEWVRLVKSDDNKCRVQVWTHSCKQVSSVVGDFRNGSCQSGKIDPTNSGLRRGL